MTQHPMDASNPFCPTCGLRTYPQWGPHVCGVGQVSEEEIRKIRHAAGDILANLHFYRLPAAEQIAALSEALAFTLALNVRRDKLGAKWIGLKFKLQKLMFRQAGLTDRNVVARVSQTRMTIPRKKKKKVTHAPVVKKRRA